MTAVDIVLIMVAVNVGWGQNQWVKSNGVNGWCMGYSEWCWDAGESSGISEGAVQPSVVLMGLRWILECWVLRHEGRDSGICAGVTHTSDPFGPWCTRTSCGISFVVRELLSFTFFSFFVLEWWWETPGLKNASWESLFLYLMACMLLSLNSHFLKFWYCYQLKFSFFHHVIPDYIHGYTCRAYTRVMHTCYSYKWMRRLLPELEAEGHSHLIRLYLFGGRQSLRRTAGVWNRLCYLETRWHRCWKCIVLCQRQAQRRH